MPVPYIVTGGPGTGKSTVLAALMQHGYPVQRESARDIIQERQQSGQSPRSDPAHFAAEIFARDTQGYDQLLTDHAEAQHIFCDRGLVDALYMLTQAQVLERHQVETELARRPHHRTVFFFPPWQSIYRQDDQRDHSFSQCQDISASLAHWYQSLGFELCIMPLISVTERVAFIIDQINQDS